MKSPSCVGCVCSAARAAAPQGRLVLGTQVEHTATALRTLARRHGLTLRPLAPGLLAMDTTRVAEFVALAHDALSSVEANEVRCVVLSSQDLPAEEVLAQALTAPTLAAAGARVAYADLLPLFADETGSFHCLYQPIVTLPGRSPIGVEALLRATTPDGQPVTPDVLFPAAEAAGWTHLVDRVGRTTALRGAAGWLPPDQLLFINFIPTSIYRPEVCLRTTELAAREANIRLDQIVFEVTEGHQVRDVDHLEAVFDYYRSHDCKVALDDLGAGYSSLNMLVRLRPDIVKLDKDLVQALPDPTSRAVVTAIVDITHSYGGQVLAECVETEEQAAVATDLGVDLGQGWLFGHPERRTTQAPRRTSTEVHKQSVAHQANTDSLTGLAHRGHLLQQLQACLDAGALGGRAVAVLFLDLDRFKEVNDTLGTTAGDSILIQVVERLRGALRTSDLICRNGGDAFVAVLNDLDPLDAARVADRAGTEITTSLQRPFAVGAASVTVGGCVGVSVYPYQATTADQLLALAEANMSRTRQTHSQAATRT